MSISLPGSARWVGAILAGVVAGATSVKPTIGAVVAHDALCNGPWRTSLTTGSKGGNLYERAAIAVSGLYALAKEETIYFTAFTDADGEQLDARCDYDLRGVALPARWWSLTMYGADDFLVDNPARIYSRHAANLALGPDGAFAIAVSPREQPRNWLPAPSSGSFSITLRLYNPAPTVYENPQAVPLPQLTRGTCR